VNAIVISKLLTHTEVGEVVQRLLLLLLSLLEELLKVFDYMDLFA